MCAIPSTPLGRYRGGDDRRRDTTKDVKRSTPAQQPTILLCQLECETLPRMLPQEA